MRPWSSRSWPTRMATCIMCASIPARSKANSRVLESRAPRSRNSPASSITFTPIRSIATSLPDAPAGDIVAIIGPKDSITGDTLCDPQHPIVLEQIEFAEAVVSMSIEPESSADKDKLELALGRLKKEDPTFTWQLNPDTGQSLISGMGILHLEVKKNQARTRFPPQGQGQQAAGQLSRNAARPIRVEGNASSKRARRACSPRSRSSSSRENGARATPSSTRCRPETLPPELIGRGRARHSRRPAIRRAGLSA